MRQLAFLVLAFYDRPPSLELMVKLLLAFQI